MNEEFERERGVGSIVRRVMFGADLTICSLWAVALMRNLTLWPLGGFLTLIIIGLRLLLPFMLMQREKRSWVPWTLFAMLTLLKVWGGYEMEVDKLSNAFLSVMGMEDDESAQQFISWLLWGWIGAAPVVAYTILYFRGALQNRFAGWKSYFGHELWNDRRFTCFASLLIVLPLAIFVGLASYSRLSLWACLIFPSVSYYLLARHYAVEKRHIFILLAALCIFFYDSRLGLSSRLWVLPMTTLMVFYACRPFHTKWRFDGWVWTAALTFYLGVLLPCFTLGYNPYTDAYTSRRIPLPFEAFEGIYYLKDAKTGKVGLRNRYGTLIEPEYESIDYHDGCCFWKPLELRKNGYYTLYNPLYRHFSTDNQINHLFQDEICPILKRHLIYYNYEFSDRMEVRIKEMDSGELVAHLKCYLSRNEIRFRYNSDTHILEKPGEVPAGQFGTHLFETPGQNLLQVLSYAQEVKREEGTGYRIEVVSAKVAVSKREELTSLAQQLETLIQQTTYLTTEENEDAEDESESEDEDERL